MTTVTEITEQNQMIKDVTEELESLIVGQIEPLDLLLALERRKLKLTSYE